MGSLYAERWHPRLLVDGRWWWVHMRGATPTLTRDRRIASMVSWPTGGEFVCELWNRDGDGRQAVAWEVLEVPPYGPERIVREGTVTGT